jgi:hypothetical protein
MKVVPTSKKFEKRCPRALNGTVGIYEMYFFDIFMLYPPLILVCSLPSAVPF